MKNEDKTAFEALVKAGKDAFYNMLDDGDDHLGTIHLADKIRTFAPSSEKDKIAYYEGERRRLMEEGEKAGYNSIFNFYYAVKSGFMSGNGDLFFCWIGHFFSEGVLTEKLTPEEKEAALERWFWGDGNGAAIMWITAQIRALNFEGIADDFKDYIQGATDSMLVSIIQHHTAPDGQRPVWIGTKSDAARFAANIGISEGGFRRCFDGSRIPSRSLICRMKNGPLYKDEDRAGTLYMLLDKWVPSIESD